MNSETLENHSKFFYGIEIDSQNNYLDFNEGLIAYSVRIPRGKYSPRTLAKRIQTEMNLVSVGNFEVSFDYNALIFNIKTNPTTVFTLKFATGANAALSIRQKLGWIAIDLTGVNFSSTAPIDCKIYSTQFPLQSYNDPNSHKKLFDPVVNKTYGNRVELVSFGESKMLDFKLDYISDILGHDSAMGYLRDNPTGKQDAIDFLNWCMYKGHIDFFVDENDLSSVPIPIICDSTGNGQGSEYFLQEKYGQDLIGYFETQKISFSVLQFIGEDSI